MFECLYNGPLMLGVIVSVLSAFTLGLAIGIKAEKRFKERTERKSSGYFQRQFINQEE